MNEETLKARVEFFCREMCEELGIDPDVERSLDELDIEALEDLGVIIEKDSEIIELTKRPAWEDFYEMIEEWLIDEAFRKIRSKHWDSEHRKNLGKAVIKK